MSRDVVYMIYLQNGIESCNFSEKAHLTDDGRMTSISVFITSA